MHYELAAETDAFGALVRVSITPHPGHWTEVAMVDGKIISTRELPDTPVIEAAQEMVLSFTSLLMVLSLGQLDSAAESPPPLT